MKNRIFTLGVMALLFAACSVNEMDIATPTAKDAEEFFATIEDASTRVFVDDDLMVLWHADDRVSIFNKYTYNQQYRFTGNTGANSGSFTKVPNDDFVTGNALNSVYAIYPYKESTDISNQGVLTIDLPATQSYAENSFGVGANTMVSCSEGNELLFKNLCGYIMLKLYGDNVTVKSISIKGNNDEPLAGKATVNASIENAPTLSFDASATKEITLTFDAPVTLGTTPETATTFWLVVPPTTFSKGITLTVKDNKNGEFKKSTTASLQISRNTLKRLSALQATPEPSDDAIVFADSKLKERLVAKFDTNGDGELSYKEAAAVTSIEGAVTIKTITSFDEFQYFTGVSYIPKSCFESWSNLNSIVLPASITHIDNLAFKDCISLSELVLPDSVSRLGYGVFYGCSALKRMVLPNSISGELGFIYDTRPNYSDQIYEMGLFQGCSSLEEVVLPNSITALGVNLFYMCKNLNSLEIPSSIKRYSYGTFQGCKNLSSIKLQDSITAIPGYLFYGCENITSIVIPQTVTRINYGAFGGTGITSIEIPESVTYIGESAFSGTKLTAVSIPESVSYIEDYLFSGCSDLASVSIPESVTGIGRGAFANCFKLEDITIPNSVSTIGDEAFRGCLGLTSISIPESVKSIGQRAFSRCANLASLYLPNTTINLNESFEYCTALTSIVIPAKIEGFQYAFQYCTSLKSVTLSDGLPLISMYAFLGCESIETIRIPASVTHIYNGAFLSCSGLSSIMVESSTPPSGSIQMFVNTNNCPIYVPSESIEEYKSTRYWSDYVDRIQAIPDFFFNGKPLSKEDENVYSGIVSLQKNESIKLDGDIQLTSFWLDPDFVVNGCFNAVNGLYKVTLNKGDFTITFRRVNADGSAPNLSEGGLYLQGWGVAEKKMSEFIGWPGTGGYQLAQVSDGVYQFTGKAVNENATEIGGRFRRDYVKFGYFFQDGWGNEASAGVTISGNAASLFEQESDKKFHNLVEQNASLDLGSTYRLIIDFTNTTISGNAITSGIETVRIDKL